MASRKKRGPQVLFKVPQAKRFVLAGVRLGVGKWDVGGIVFRHDQVEMAKEVVGLAVANAVSGDMTTLGFIKVSGANRALQGREERRRDIPSGAG